MKNKKEIVASCTWGFGPDIMLNIKGGVLLHESVIDLDRTVHGICKEISLDLTKDDAKKMVAHLLQAISAVEDLERVLDLYLEDQ